MMIMMMTMMMIARQGLKVKVGSVSSVRNRQTKMGLNIASK